MAEDGGLTSATTVRVARETSGRLKRKKQEFDAKNADEVIRELLDFHDAVAEHGEVAEDII